MLVQPVDSYTLHGVIVTPIKTPFGLDITLELLYSCSNYNECSYRNSFILHIVFAGLIRNDHKDILSTFPNRAKAQLNCPAPPNKSLQRPTHSLQLSVLYIACILAYCVIKAIFFIQTQYLNVLATEMCSLAFTRFLFCLLHFFSVDSLYFSFDSSPLHCLPVTMWIYLSQRWNRANSSLLYWKVLMHWAHFMLILSIPIGYLSCPFCTFVQFERNPCWRKSFILWNTNEDEASWSF